MIERGDTVLVFPEGGRSYTGAMLEMRIGVLGASILSQANTPERDVNYIPIAVSYESPPDVPWFDMQIKGKKWRKHSNPLPKRLIGNLLYYGADIFSFLPFIIAQKFKRNYGKAYIDYGPPVAIRSLLDIGKLKSEKARDDFSAHRDAMIKLGEIAHEQLFKLYRILPMHIVAAHLKLHDQRSVSDLADAIPGMIADLKAVGRNTKQLEAQSPSETAIEGIRQLRKIHAIKFNRKICSIHNNSLVSYYAATIG
jgi:glycerol-3-phosphate O-acyltransferase